MSSPKRIAILDLDAMLHIVANVQFKSGNQENAEVTKAHIHRFIGNIKASSQCTHSIGFFQDIGHQNFRNTILPEYKGHRVTSDAIKCWKPAIMDAFTEAGAISLNKLESDDAASIVADHYGYKNCVIITSDKDMGQVPCDIYNPYKKNLKQEERWFRSSLPIATRFLWKQTLSGDSTDMPNALCGIEGVGEATADKLINKYPDTTPYSRIIQQEYSKKYGSEVGYARANRTYMMVRLLTKQYNPYIDVVTQNEIDHILNVADDFLTPIKSDVKELFAPAKVPFDPTKLFLKD